jgi:hypothetical protein
MPSQPVKQGLETLADIEYKLAGGVKGAPAPWQSGPDIYIPVVDELASAEEAKQSGASALEALKKGEYGEAGLEGLRALLSAAGVVPLAGAPARAASKVSKKLQDIISDEKKLDESKVATRWFRGSNNPKELEGSFTKEKEGVLGGGGVYITPNKEYAERYAKEDIFGAPKEGGFVNELEVGFKNPLVVDITSDRPYPELELFKKLGYKEDKAMDIVEKAMEEKGGLTNEVKNKVIKQGYDGIILRKDGEIQEALIYDTNNIKAIAGEVPLKKGGSVVERNPYNYTAKAI